jgi:hypothetical protein
MEIIMLSVWSEAFAATGMNKIFSGNYRVRCMKKPTFRGPCRSLSSGMWYDTGDHGVSEGARHQDSLTDRQSQRDSDLARTLRLRRERYDDEWPGELYIYMKHHGFQYHITSLMMRTEMVLETSVSFIHLTRLMPREDFVECRLFVPY